MKKIALSAALVLVSSSAFAAQLSTCLNNVSQRCGSLTALVGMASVSSNQCSIVQAGTREDGTKYAEKVIFKDSNSVVSVELQDCGIARADIYGQFGEQKQYLGRLFSVTKDGRVVVVGRDNGLVMLINSKNKPYSSVTDIKIQGDIITLTFENHQFLDLDAQDVLKKLNTPAARIN
jgi:hypothetical protein